MVYVNSDFRVDIYAWDEKVASILEHNGTLYVEPTPLALDLSPLNMKVLGAKSYPDLAFQSYLPGLFSDALPGSYGLSYMDSYFMDKRGSIPSVLERLLFLGDNTLGALSFRPQMQTKELSGIIDLRDAHAYSKKAIEGVHDFDLAMLMALSSSAGGGARAKAIAGFNHKSKEVFIASKHVTLPEDFMHAIIKFDEYKVDGHAHRPALYTDASVYTKTEYIYSLIAKKLGIIMSDTFLVDTKEGAHFVTERFDRENGERIHMHSLSGLLHHDASRPKTLGYEMVFRTALALDVPHANREQIFKVMVFNLVFGNRDDHSKNFSFLYTPTKKWCFSPAYDLSYVINSGAGSEHQLLINDRPASWIKGSGLMMLAKTFAITNVKEIIQETIEAKHSLFLEFAKEHQLPDAWVLEILSKTKEIDTNLGDFYD